MSAAPEMPVRALAPWFGGKRNLAPAIVEQIGPHRVYWEPFCGSMAVTMAKPPCVMETVNDLHGDLINLARVVVAYGPELYRLARRLIMHEDILAEYKRQLDVKDVGDEPDLDRALAYFAASWLGRNGCAGSARYNNHFCVRYTANGGHAAKRLRSATSSIPAWSRRLRNVTILRRDAFEIIERIEDRAGTAIYVDPPYVLKGTKYEHDLEPDDHRRLAEQLARFRESRVVVSYYPHPLLDELYAGWSRTEINVSKSIAHQGRHGENDVRAVEMLLVNGDVVGDGHLFGGAA